MKDIKNIAEWEIIGFIDTGLGGVALGFCNESPTPYATWVHTGNYDFHNGRYFKEGERALNDFYERARIWCI